MPLSAGPSGLSRPCPGWPSQGYPRHAREGGPGRTLTSVSTPFGDFLRATRDATRPESLGLPAGSRRRVPGLRRAELATLAGISVEYLIRIEQGRDRNPSIAVVNALADALRLDGAARLHLRHLAKLNSGTCLGTPADLRLDVRPTVRAMLDQLEPGIALVTNRLGDVLAYTSGFEQLTRATGLLDVPRPNLTRFVFTDDRARDVFPDWAQLADELASDLWLGPPAEQSERFRAELAAVAGKAFTERLYRNDLPRDSTQRWRHPVTGELRFEREVLELSAADGQQLVVLLPADDTTADTLRRLNRAATGPLRAVN
jgi:transcriptional regulator with XRE-family HTH domain